MTKFVKPFHFKQFSIAQRKDVFRVGTDGVLLGAWTNVSNCERVLEIGTGSGLIPMMLAQRSEMANITAIDINESAVELANENFEACPWTNRLCAFHYSIQTYASSANQKFDLIVTNPPYFQDSTLSKHQKIAQAKHTISLSAESLIKSIIQLLLPTGRFSLILPTKEGHTFQDLANEHGLFLNRITEVYPKKEKPVERLLMEFSFKAQVIIAEKLVIQKERRNDFTEDYIHLTKKFHTIL